MPKELRLHQVAVLRRRGVAVEKEATVRRVVVVSVEVDKILVGKIRNLLRISPGIVPVGGLRENAPQGPLPGDGIVVGVVSLHLVKDDAGPDQLSIIIKFQPVPFLGEHLLREKGKEDRVAVDPHDVEEVFLIRARRGVDRLIGVGQGVEKGAHAPFHQHQEGILEGIVFRTAENGVLENVGDTSRVLGWRQEGEGEDVLRVVADDVVGLHAGYPMTEADADATVLRKLLVGENLEAGENRSDGGDGSFDILHHPTPGPGLRRGDRASP